ncbi:hypothetical protein [Thermomonas sp.]|uniref:hypothetical protein n=1 Tax=Thermomonas sp. TaxID=1971895 RepID=UPI003D11D4FD
MRQSILVTLLLGTSFTLTGNLALAQSASTQDEGSASAQRITIKQKSSNVKGATDPRSRENGACDRPYVWSTLQQKCVLPLRYQQAMIDSTARPSPSNRQANGFSPFQQNDVARPVPSKPPAIGDQTPVDPATGPKPHPVDPLPPTPRPKPIPGVAIPSHHMPRDPGMGNGEVSPNPGGNPVEPALPCPPGFQVVQLKNGQTTCAKPTPANPMPPSATARQAASSQDHVQICPPYCGSTSPQAAQATGKPGRPVLINRPQVPSPIEERRPNAGNTEPGGIMGPAGSPVPPMGGIKPPPGSALPSRCPLGSHWVGPDPRSNKQGHCERDKVPTE